MSRLIMHVDMDAFFAAVEQRDYPEYRGKPVVVGAQPGQRGVVAACSYEARRFGIRSAMPISEAYRRCPGAVYVPPDPERYVEASGHVMACLDTISPVVEPVSIDEAYVDITGLKGLFGAPEMIGRITKERILAATQLNASVGIGPNRLIAKLASDHNKPDGLTIVPDDQVDSFLDRMPIAVLRGVGKKTLPRLMRMGFNTLGELRSLTLEHLRQELGGRLAESIYQQVRGMGSDVVETEQQRKSISKETTFNKDQSNLQYLRETLRQLAAEVGYRAREMSLSGHVITLKLRLDNFETATRQRRLAHATQSDRMIFQTAWQLYQDSGLADRPVRLIGVGISGWCEEQPLQPDLFGDPSDVAEEKGLYGVMDRVTGRFGRESLQFGLRRTKK